MGDLFSLPDLYEGAKCIFKSSWPLTGSKWWNPDGQMDKWLGKEVTIKQIRYHDFLIEEDVGEFPAHGGGHWHWRPSIIEEIIEDPELEIEVIDNEAVLSFLMS